MKTPVPKLSARLLAAAMLVKSGRIAADIGTDHAYLPVYLVLNGISPSAIASDLRQGPLNHAKRTIERFNVSQHIRLLLSDGLSAFSPNDAEEFLFCGMGGELIADILQHTGWIKNKRYGLVLQPMSAIAELRQWLFENGFKIQEESLAAEKKHIYYIMRAAAGKTGRYKPYELVFGQGLKKDELSLKYLESLICRYKLIADKAGASVKEKDIPRAENAEDILKGLIGLHENWVGEHVD